MPLHIRFAAPAPEATAAPPNLRTANHARTQDRLVTRVRKGRNGKGRGRGEGLGERGEVVMMMVVVVVVVVVVMVMVIVMVMVLSGVHCGGRGSDCQ